MHLWATSVFGEGWVISLKSFHSGKQQRKYVDILKLDADFKRRSLLGNEEMDLGGDLSFFELEY